MELLVVIAIIGILATLLLLQLNIGRSKGRDTKRVADVNQLRTAAELYFDDNSTYPPDIDDATIGKYMSNQKTPLDPSTNLKYGYGVNALKTKFQIWAQFENPGPGGAFRSDADINDAALIGGTDGTKEVPASGKCTQGAGAADCVFDLGVD